MEQGIKFMKIIDANGNPGPKIGTVTSMWRVKPPIGIPTLSSGGLGLCVLTPIFQIYHDYKTGGRSRDSCKEVTSETPDFCVD